MVVPQRTVIFHFSQGAKRVDTMQGHLEFGGVEGSLVSGEKMQSTVGIRDDR